MNYIYCIIVIYNSNLSQSIAYNNILKCNMTNCKIIVVDNSINGIDNSSYCTAHKNTTLLQMNHNLGLTRGMNIGLDYISSLHPKDNDLIVLLNDDTEITKDFFELLKERSDKNQADIFAPVIQGTNGIYYSPATQGFFKNHYIKSVNETPPQDNFFAIMSATAAKWSILKDYRFDEKIFMDLLDNDFCDYQRSLGRRFEKLNIVIQHNLALKNSGLTIEQIQRRYQIWIPDFLTYCRKKKIRIIGFFPAIAARGIMLSWQCKNIKFWFWAMIYAFKCFQK